MPPDPFQDARVEQWRGPVTRDMLADLVSLHEQAPCAYPRAQLDRDVLSITGHNGTASTKPDPELDEWRATYGRLDIPVTVIDWRPVYAGAAALGIALLARWVVRHGR